MSGPFIHGTRPGLNVEPDYKKLHGELTIERDRWRNKATELADHVNRLMRERDEAVRQLAEQRAVAEELRQLLNLSRG